jgi:hypothetical protein
MQNKSKIRISLIPTFIIAVSVLSIVPLSFYLTGLGGIKNYNNDGTINISMIVVGTFCLSVIAFFIFKIYTRSLIVSINEEDKNIKFIYPFKFKKKVYPFDDIIGFRFTKFYSRLCDYKILVFKANDNKIYKITDFETSNLRVIEDFAIKHFEIFNNKDFDPLTTEEKVFELKKIKMFDIDQAKSYRISSYLGILLSVSIILINKYIAIPQRKSDATAWTISSIIFLICLFYIFKANKTINAANKALSAIRADS